MRQGFIFILTILFSVSVFAGGDGEWGFPSKSKSTISKKPVKKKIVRRAIPRSNFVYAKMYSGSLHNNLARIAAKNNWKLVWARERFDYNWQGNVTVKADNIQGVFSNVLKPYPLQAIFYKANKVILVKPQGATV